MMPLLETRLEILDWHVAFLPFGMPYRIKLDQFGHEWHVAEQEGETVAVRPGLWPVQKEQMAWNCTVYRLQPRKHWYSLIVPPGRNLCQHAFYFEDIFGWRIETRSRMEHKFSARVNKPCYWYPDSTHERSIADGVPHVRQHPNRRDYDWLLVRDCYRRAAEVGHRCLQCGNPVFVDWSKNLPLRYKEVMQRMHGKACLALFQRGRQASAPLIDWLYGTRDHTCSQRCWHKFAKRLCIEENEKCRDRQTAESLRKAMARVSRVLKKRDPDALQSLKEEFDLLASSRK